MVMDKLTEILFDITKHINLFYISLISIKTINV